jgi:phenylacetate-coenzyme A ligase PaaK-like adenylate-forming protein
MKKIYALSLFSAIAFWGSAQTFTMNTSLVTTAHHSGGCTGVADMNNDGLDDIIILDESVQLSIAYQQADGSFGVYAVLRQGGLVKSAFAALYALEREITLIAIAEVDAANDADGAIPKQS